MKKKKHKWKHIKVDIKSPTEQRKNFPRGLVDAFLAVKNSNWEGEKEYKRYIKLGKKYLGNKWEDRLEQGRLVVWLTKATMDIK